MAKLIKGDNVQNIITDGDVIVTSPSKIGKTLDEVLVEQQSDIDRLKSNIKYIYAYGGVGGSGSGGGGTGSGNGPISILITLNGVAVNKSGSAIILDGAGKYTLYVKVSNAGGKNLFMGYTTNGSTVTDSKMTYPLNGDNKYRMEMGIQLDSNGVLNIAFCDDEGNNIGDYYSQPYIVNSDQFDVTLNYVDMDGNVQQYIEEPYECFVKDFSKTQRHIKLKYFIFLPEYDKDSVGVECSIDGVGEIYSGSDKSVEIPLESILIGNETILKDKYLGTYVLNATLTYTVAGKPVVRKKSFKFSIIPSGLFVNIRTAGDVLYDSTKLLESDVDGEGKPRKYISQGSSLLMYSKVFEGSLGTTNRYTYDVIYKAFDVEVDEEGKPKLNDNGDDYIWNQLNIEDSETLTEQIESNTGVAVTFSTPGIKKIEVTTIGRKDEVGIEKVFKKYLYVKPYASTCEWYNSNLHAVLSDNYFRANQGDKTYNNFPPLSSGEGVMSLLISSDPIVLSRESWTSINENVCTSISFGIQVSNINSENAKILDIYTHTSGQEYEYSLRTERLFTDVSDEKNKIAIPTETLNKNINSQYHLVQIIRNYVGSNVYEDSLYIDGMLESVNRNTTMSPLLVKKLILNNINACYNLINIQYISPNKGEGKNLIKFNPDGYAYQYWLSYKEKYVNSNVEGDRLSPEENFMLENMNRIFFDGTNVVINGDDSNILVDIANNSDLPTVVFGYNCNNGENYKTVDSFMNMMWEGRSNGADNSFGSRTINLYWIPARANINGKELSDFNVEIPSGLTDNTYNQPITGNYWQIDLQGTSTMRNRIKNYSLRIKGTSQNNIDKILFSPNFNIEDPKTFLPDIEWTIKADIADSAHANNTSIGKFVNDFCTPIDTNIPDINDEIYSKEFIKNTLEGIPVLLYFMCTDADTTKIYYFGIYNFNLGRTSHYNLGYTGGVDDSGRSDFVNVFKNITNRIDGKYATNGAFTFAVGEDRLSPNIAIGEIQDNYAEFDFHQYDYSLLFNESGNSIACMFGTDDKIVASGTNKPIAKGALERLVKGVAKAGKYCFQRLGRGGDLRTSAVSIGYDDNGKEIFEDNCANRYSQGYLPDTVWQKTYTKNADANGSYVVWKRADQEFIDVNENDLKNLITRYEVEGEENKPILNFTSAAEYYTICMAFGMVDSVLKNMNLKNFRSREEGNNFYCAFYDMDCALEEANDGEEKISYLAATDYWYSNIDTNTYKVSKILKKNDYWDSVNGGNGFNFTSSYLFAVVKYAKAILGEKYADDLSHYPQNFWAKLRRPYIDENDKGGGLQNVNYFMENYFKSGITTTFEYLASLNYRVKYLYKGGVLGDNDVVVDKFLANAAAFNGSRRIKVKNWLSKRLRFMDLMMNVNNLSVEISNGVYYPGPGSYGDTLERNNDITILHSAFDTNGANTAITTHDGVEVSIYAPKHTPFIFRSGSTAADIYLLPGGVEYPNKISLYTKATINARFFGSGQFTSVDKIETMFTSNRSIISNNIEKITYGGTTVFGNTGEFNINAKSVTEIKLDIPNMGGKLLIDQNCQSLMKLNIANSNFYGVFSGFANLQEVNISGVSSDSPDGIYVSGSNHLTGEKFHISGSDENHKTKLTVLDISGVTGNFRCENTNIGKIRISNSTDRKSPGFNSSMLSEFYISGDKSLIELSLNGFRKVYIDKCINLATLTIDDALEELYINMEKVEKGEDESQLKTIYLNKKTEDNGDSDSDSDIIDIDRTGIFDFTNYTNLKKVTLINCDRLVHVKLPDHDVETDGMSNNINLKYIDTGILPSFSDNNAYDGAGEYSGMVFPKYKDGKKLILCSSGAFYNCPNYNMLRSDWYKYQDMTGDEKNGYNESTGTRVAFTNISVSKNCASLSNTFNCTSTNNPSIDPGSNNQRSYIFNMSAANRFVDICVPLDVKGSITSFEGCFRGRKGIIYTKAEGVKDDYKGKDYCPNLSLYTLLNDISGMYYNTGVTFISEKLLSLPENQNKPDNTLSWGYFVNKMNTGVDISKTALKNISYRLDSYSGFKFNIFEYDDVGEYILAGTEENKLDICKFFCPTKDENDPIKPYNNITSIDSLNFGDQYIDFTEMFNLFPNVETIHNFLNGKLRKYKIDGLLKPCANITSIINSFCDDDIDNDIDKPQIIDLYEFFNWEGNRTDVENLFEGKSGNNFTNGFRVRKTITYDNFNKVLEKITQYEKLKLLTNLFSYCTITGYKDVEEKDREIKFKTETPLSNIINISYLFEKCTSDYKPFANSYVGENKKGIYTGGVLYIGRSFFEKLPYFRIAQRTLANTYLSSPLTYDYFCKRGKKTETPILLSKNNDDIATLHEYVYSSDIMNLKECFYNTKFVNCKNWFDHDSDINKSIIPENLRNYISIGDGDNQSKYSDERGQVYYKYNIATTSYEEYILDNNAIDDCLDNYTDYIVSNVISDYTFYNHDLYQDFLYYGNIKDDKLPFKPTNNTNTIQKTYCCLPPDFLYGCSNTAIVDGIFANSNITGVIPRNLTKKIKNRSIPNIFRNVNIMPNLEYYYDSNNTDVGGLNGILNDITDTVEIYDGSDSDSDSYIISDKYTVVFRDEYGGLKKRKPVSSDKNLGQFVYVPSKFTTSDNLTETFNFRYNLPQKWGTPNKSSVNNLSGCKSTREFNDLNLNLDYHTQYYFTTDESVMWDVVRNARNVFITNSQDIDFSNINTIGNTRVFCDFDTNYDAHEKNAWTYSSNNDILDISTSSGWSNSNIIEDFYIDLNLCGQKKKYYNMLEDYGCPIVIKNRDVKLDNFISGILTVFLNGRVFYDGFAIDELTTSYHKNVGSSYVIDYYGFGKNIILPKCSGSPIDKYFVFMPIDKYNVIYYDFMLNDGEDGSIREYKTWFGEENLIINDSKNKYTFK